jgi:hypothetical protein
MPSSRESDRRTFNLLELERSIAFRATVIARLRASLSREPARFQPETESNYRKRCVSARVSIESKIEQEERLRAFEIAELARCGAGSAGVL